LVVGEHVPDGFGELASDREGGELAAALAPVSGTVALEDRLVERVAAGGVGCFDERPAEVVGAVLAQGPRRSLSPDCSTFGVSPVYPISLVGVRKRSMSPISEAIVKARIQATPGRVMSSGT